MNTASEKLSLATLALSMFLSSLGVSIANAALPALAKVFDATFSETRWVILGYLLSLTIWIVGVGRWGDLWGRRRVLLIGIWIYTVASILCGLSPTLEFLIVARALQGLGGAILVTLTVALVSESVPKERTGRAMGLLGTMSAVGTALGPSLSGVLLDIFSWRAIFLVAAPLGLLNFILAFRYVPSSKNGSSKQILQWKNLRDLSFAASLVMNTLVSTVMMSTLVIGPFYLSRALGFDQVWVGIVMSVGPCVSILSGVLAGRLVDRIGARLGTTLGLAEMVVGIAALTILPFFFGLPGYLISVLILSPGYQLFLAANNTSVMSQVASDQKGVVSGLLSLSRNLGLITGASVIGAVFSRALGEASNAMLATVDPQAVAEATMRTFAVVVVVAIVALLISIFHFGFRSQ